MYEFDYEELKNQLKANKAQLKAELESEQDIKIKEDEDTRQKQYNKQINYNVLTQRQYQGRIPNKKPKATATVTTMLMLIQKCYSKYKTWQKQSKTGFDAAVKVEADKSLNISK